MRRVELPGHMVKIVPEWFHSNAYANEAKST